MFTGPAAVVLMEAVNPFLAIPGQLRRLSALLSVDGKPGRKREVFANELLIMASEFVRLKLGSFYDEHVAELFQSISPDDSFTDLSGDAIRKKRRYLKDNYPQVYDHVLTRAERMSRQ